MQPAVCGSLRKRADSRHGSAGARLSASASFEFAGLLPAVDWLAESFEVGCSSALPVVLLPEPIRSGLNSQLLVAVSRAHRHALAADRAASAQHSCPALGLHSRPKTVCLHSFPAIWLKCALWHRNALLFLC